MRKKESSKTSLFLLELMISIVFFALAAAGCVQVFAKAHVISIQAEHLDQAVSIAQSLAESCRTPGEEVRYYDMDGEACEEENGVYQAQTVIADKDGMLHLDITVSLADPVQTEEELYHLETDVYVQGGKE